MNELNVNSHNKDDTPNTLISFEIPLDSVITIASLSLLLKQKTFITKISKSFPILELKISLHTHIQIISSVFWYIKNYFLLTSLKRYNKEIYIYYIQYRYLFIYAWISHTIIYKTFRFKTYGLPAC